MRRLTALAILSIASFTTSVAYAQGPLTPFTPGAGNQTVSTPWCLGGSLNFTPYCGPVRYPACSRSSPCLVWGGAGQVASRCDEWIWYSRIPGKIQRRQGPVR
jgi:hypothetical protein